MASRRVYINSSVVDEALAQAEAGVQGIFDYVDIHLSYLVLRVRGNAVSWLVKTRDLTRKIGAPPKMLVREARKTAPTTLVQLRMFPATEPGSESDVSPTPGWTWEELRTAYLEHIKKPRVKRNRARHPSKKTWKDVNFSLRCAAFEEWQSKPINTLKAGDLVKTIQAIQKAHSQRQCEKSLSYAKAALNWALSNHADSSGLSESNPWWIKIVAPEPSEEEVEKILTRQRTEKEDHFTVEHLGMLLARHEDFCRGKTGNRKIAPGVRWGLWWDALTINRRGAATMLMRDAINWEDPRGLPGWGLVWWPEEIMKTRLPLWLPIPPLGLHILRSVMRDWRELVNKSHGQGNTTKWVFASTRRIGRLDDNTDVVVAPDALSNHLRNLRGQRDHNHRNFLEGIPYFTLHIIRNACASYLLDRKGLAPGAASALLAHTIKGDVDPRHEKMSPTTRQFYDFAQRLPLKTEAMEAWSNQLMKCYKDAGGIYPQ